MKRVLIAEDNELLANLWKNALRMRMAAVEVIVARDGQEAVDMAERHKPDLILMDVMMPKIDGLEAFRRLSTENGNPPAVMFISCLARSADIEEAHRMRAVDFLVKGRFSVQSLVDRVSRLLDERRLVSGTA